MRLAANTKRVSHLGVREALTLLADHLPPAEANAPLPNAAEYLVAAWGRFRGQMAEYLEHCNQAFRLAGLGDWGAFIAHAKDLGPARLRCKVAGDDVKLAMNELEKAVSEGAVPIGDAAKVFSNIAADKTAAANTLAAGYRLEALAGRLIKGGASLLWRTDTTTSRRRIRRKSCEGKRRFSTLPEAIAAAEILRARGEDTIHAYHCDLCSGAKGDRFHVGHHIVRDVDLMRSRQS